MIFTHFDTLAKSDKFARNDLFSGINPFSTSYFEAIFHYLNKIGCSSAYLVSFQKVTVHGVLISFGNLLDIFGSLSGI